MAKQFRVRKQFRDISQKLISTLTEAVILNPAVNKGLYANLSTRFIHNMSMSSIDNLAIKAFIRDRPDISGINPNIYVEFNGREIKVVPSHAYWEKTKVNRHSSPISEAIYKSMHKLLLQEGYSHSELHINDIYKLESK